MAGRKRYAKRRRPKRNARRKQNMSAGSRLMSQKATGGTRSFKMAQLFNLVLGPSATATTNAVMMNFSLLNIPVFAGVPLFNSVTPNSV